MIKAKNFYLIFTVVNLPLILFNISLDQTSATIERDKDVASYYYNKGNDLRKDGITEEAIIYYDKALEINPSHKEAHNNKGIALEDLEKYEEAIAEFDKAIELEPRDENTYNNKGNALRELGRYEEAIAEYDKALEIYPDYLKALENKERTVSLLEKSSDNTNLNQAKSNTANEKKAIDIGTDSPSSYKSPESKADELLKLSDLKDKGIISDDEFINLKENILNSN